MTVNLDSLAGPDPYLRSYDSEHREHIRMLFQDYMYKDVEVVSLDAKNAPVPRCLKHLRRFVTSPPPMFHTPAVGTTLDDGLPVVCIYVLCFKFDPSREGWNFWRPVLENRDFWNRVHEGYYYPNVMATAVDESKREMFFSSFHVGYNIVEWTGDGGRTFNATSSMVPRLDHCLAAVSDNPDAWIFVAGGHDSESMHMNSTLTYSQKSDDWIKRADMPTERASLESLVRQKEVAFF